jgi:AcrR family transcriptional regulator
MKTDKPSDGTGRGKGRPHKDKNPMAREALVEAGKELLKTQPPAQINRLEIAQNAGVDPGLVRYYFDNKDLLLLEASERIMRDVRARRRKASKNQSSFRGKLAISAASTVQVLMKYPYLHDLLLEQIHSAHLAKAGHLHDVFIDSPFSEIKQILDQATEAGEIRPVEAAFFHVALIGMCSFPMRHRALLSELLGTDDLDAEAAARYTDFVVEVLINGVAAKEPKANKSVEPAGAHAQTAASGRIGKRSSNGRRSGSTSNSKEPVSRPKPT